MGTAKTDKSGRKPMPLTAPRIEIPQSTSQSSPPELSPDLPQVEAVLERRPSVALALHRGHATACQLRAAKAMSIQMQTIGEQARARAQQEKPELR